MQMGKRKPRFSLFGDGLPAGDRKGPWPGSGEGLSLPGARTVPVAAGFQPGAPQNPAAGCRCPGTLLPEGPS